MENKSKNVEIPVYVRRTLDMSFDTNGYPHTEGNRQILYAEIVKRMTPDGIANINALALEDHDFIDNEFSDAEDEAFRYCEDNGLFRPFKEDEETDEDEEDDLPAECYDDAFYKDINSPWPESKIKD